MKGGVVEVGVGSVVFEVGIVEERVSGPMKVEMVVLHLRNVLQRWEWAMLCWRLVL